MERVIDGSLFKAEIVVRVFEGDETNGDKNKPIIELLRKGLSLLEQDYLGGSGSRGYGKIKFYNLQPKELFEKPKE
jgi:CRISPR-associated protein Csm3